MAKKKASTFSIPNLSKVEGRTSIPDDEYPLKVVEIEDGEGDAGPYLKWTFAITEGDLEGKKPKPYYTSFAPDSLFNLRGLLEALGVEIPDDEFDLDKGDLIDLEVMGTIENETYQGRKQPNIVDFSPMPDDSDKGKGKKKPSKDEDEDEDKPAKGKGKKAPKKPTEEEIDEMDEDDLKGLIDEHDLDVDPDDHKTLRKLRTAVKEAIGGEDAGEGEEEEEDKGKKKGKGKKSDGYTAEEVDEMDQDELGKVVEEHDLDVDLDEFKTLRKMRGAVKDALESGDLLKE